MDGSTRDSNIRRRTVHGDIGPKYTRPGQGYPRRIRAELSSRDDQTTRCLCRVSNGECANTPDAVRSSSCDEYRIAVEQVDDVIGSRQPRTESVCGVECYNW